MAKLGAYEAKRNFTKTPEPRGAGAGKRGARKRGLQYVIQLHDASHLHYDFRLELDGVLKSWAVPRGPSVNPADKMLAVEVEDHPLDYAGFEGEIPKGQYGGGRVIVWDRGEWEPLDEDARTALAAGRLHFVLRGEKLRGAWTLVRIRGGRSGKPNWLLMKKKDEAASADLADDLRVTRPESVVSGKLVSGEHVKKAAHKSRKPEEARPAKEAAPSPRAAAVQRGARGAPAVVEPQLAVLADEAPQGSEWLHEAKFDGYRLLAHCNGGAAAMLTRKGHDWTEKFAAIAEELGGLEKGTVIDGEAVVLDARGISSFQMLQNALSDQRGDVITYFAFDLLFWKGQDWRERPLEERRERLEEIVGGLRGERVRFSASIAGRGESVNDAACRLGLEGVVSKRRDSVYVAGRAPTWVKSKCGLGQELVVLGFTPPEGKRIGLGALLLGYHDEDGGLRYAGKVGTGFGTARLKELVEQLEAIETDTAPIRELPRDADFRGVRWVRAKLVAEIRFAGWTAAGLVRQAVFKGLRTDKPAAAVVREVVKSAGRVERVAEQEIQWEQRKARGVGAAVERGTSDEKPVKATRAGGAKTARRGDRRKAEIEPAKEKAARRRGANGAGNGLATRGGRRAKGKSDAGVMVRGVTISHAERVVYPDAGVKKADVAEYYAAVGEKMLEFMAGRPLALLRCPSGVRGERFFQRHLSGRRIEGVESVVAARGEEPTPVVTGVEGLVALAQWNVLEFHQWGSRSDDVERPDVVIFDLDPGGGVPWDGVRMAGQVVRWYLKELGLGCFPKTTGGRGLHVVAPIKRTLGWTEVKTFARGVAEVLVRREPGVFVAQAGESKRRGKIFVDYLRNDRSATAVAPLSTRARPGASVAYPLSWDELADHVPEDFTVRTVPALVRRNTMAKKWTALASQTLTAERQERVQREMAER